MRLLSPGMLQDAERGNFRDYVDINNESLPPADGDDGAGVRFDDNVVEIRFPADGEPAPEEQPAEVSMAPAAASASAAVRQPLALADDEERRVRPRLEERRESVDTVPQPLSEPPAPSSRSQSEYGAASSSSERGTRTSPYPALPFPAQSGAQYLPPASPIPRMLLSVMDPDGDLPAARWCVDKRRGREELLPISDETFEISESFACFSSVDSRFYLVKKKESPGQVVFLKLPPDQKQAFIDAHAREVQSLIDTGAVEILSVAEYFQAQLHFLVDLTT